MSETPSTGRKRGLGRGLSALLGETADAYAGATAGQGGADTSAVRLVPIEHLSPNPAQPRQHFDEAALAELTESIARRGLLQPILVRPDPAAPDRFQIVAGERRWRAAQRAQLHDVPIVLRSLDDSEALELGLIENLQRRDLSPLEEAQGYRRLIDTHGHSQEAVGALVGKSRSHVANLLRLLDLPEDIKILLTMGDLSAGHARALLGAADPVALARKVVADGLSVRATEALAGAAKSKPRRAARTAAKDADTRALEADLTDRLGVPVEISHRGPGGSVTLRYPDLDSLDALLARLTAGT